MSGIVNFNEFVFFLSLFTILLFCCFIYILFLLFVYIFLIFLQLRFQVNFFYTNILNLLNLAFFWYLSLLNYQISIKTLNCFVSKNGNKFRNVTNHAYHDTSNHLVYPKFFVLFFFWRLSICINDPYSLIIHQFLN